MHTSRDVSLVVLLQALELTIAALAAFTSDLWECITCIFSLTNLVTLLPVTLRTYAEVEGLMSPALKPRAAVACDAGEVTAHNHLRAGSLHASCWPSQL